MDAVGAGLGGQEEHGEGVFLGHLLCATQVAHAGFPLPCRSVDEEEKIPVNPCSPQNGLSREGGTYWEQCSGDRGLRSRAGREWLSLGVTLF